MKQIRGKPCAWLAVLLCGLTLCLAQVLPVYAVKNEKIEELILVDNTSGGHVSKMQTYVRDQYLHNGDESQHQWVTSLPSVGSAIRDIDPNDPKPQKQAICLWVGEQYLHGFSSEFGNYFNHDCEGADSDASFRNSGDYIGYNATGLSRYLCGYDYQYEITVLDWLADGSPDWEVAPVYDEDGNLVTAGIQKSHIEHRTAHVDGLATDIQNWSGRGAQLYAFALGPVTKEKTSDGNTVQDDLKVNGVSNADVKKWNDTFSKTLKNFTFIDIYGDIGEHNPYYEGGGNSGTWYDDQMYQWIFHLMWNTILTLNPNDAPPEPISLSFYDISASLTSYLNTVLSPAADESHSDHVLLGNGTGVGNAGAFLGYGDKDYEFTSYVTGNLSKTSSVVDYSALAGITEDGSSSNMYLYSRYGRLLSDLGLDKTGTALSVGSPNLIQGGVLWILYLLSGAVNVVFMVVVGLLKGLNPFGFFQYASELSSSAKGSMGASDTLLTGTAGTKILTYLGEWYDGFYGLGYVALLFMLVIVVAGILLVPRGYKNGLSSQSVWDRIKSWLIRAVFLFIGVPVLGVSYTSVLSHMETAYTNANASQTKIVGCTFVDFKDWAKLKRLSPLSETTLVSDASSAKDGGGNAGIASDASYEKLRKTTAVINTRTGIVSGLDLSDTFGFQLQEYMDDTADRSDGSFFGNVATDLDSFREGLGLLRMYMFGDFYTAANWEGDTLSYITKQYRNPDDALDKIGRLAGKDETDAPDNTGKLYELFDVTNEPSDWLGRDKDANAELFTPGASSGQGKTWQDNRINLYSNGRLSAVSDASGSVTYTAGTGVNPDPVGVNGRDSGVKIGLSTISLYNYLSTDFDDTQMVIYSNEKAPSAHTKMQHYSVNLIGTGMISVTYYVSCFALLFAVAIIGIYYGLGVLISNVKHGLKLLFAIPAAMLGGMKSIVQVVLLVVMMVGEILGTMFLYTITSDVLFLFLTSFEQPLADKIHGITGTALGGLPAMAGFVSHPETLAGFYLGLLLLSILVIFFAGFAYRKHVLVLRFLDTVRDFCYLHVLDARIFVACDERVTEVISGYAILKALVFA